MKILSEKQSKFLGFVLCCAGVVLLAALFTLVIFLMNRAFNLFGGVFWSLAIAGMMAILLRPIICFLEEKIKMGRIQSILTLYSLVTVLVISIFWFLGGKILQQSKEIIGSAGDWPVMLEEKAVVKLPPDVWEGISPYVDGFKEYWKGLFGEVEGNALEGLDSNQEELVTALNPSQFKTWTELDDSEKEIFLKAKI